MAKFQIIYFTPKPKDEKGPIFVIGSMLETEKESVFVEANNRPCSACLGAPEFLLELHRALIILRKNERLLSDSTKRLQTLPNSIMSGAWQQIPDPKNDFLELRGLLIPFLSRGIKESVLNIIDGCRSVLASSHSDTRVGWSTNCAYKLQDKKYKQNDTNNS